MKTNLLRLFIQGGTGSGNFGHAGRPGQVGGSTPRALRALSVGKNKKRRRSGFTSADVEHFGLDYNEKRHEKVRDLHEGYWGERKRRQEEVDRRWRENDYVAGGPSKGDPLEDYEAITHDVSYVKGDAGFPKGHPFANPSNRAYAVDEAIKALSYSNLVGYGGALKKAAQGKRDDEIYQHFSNLLGKEGITLEDVLKVTYTETQGMLDKYNIPDEIPLFHGSSSFKGNHEQAFDLGTSFSGFSSWSSDEGSAALFGTQTLFSFVPRERVLVVPSQIPKQMAGVPSFFGGSRDESEYIIVSDDFFDNIGSK